MRLLTFGSSGELRFTNYLIDGIPEYAILSHTWGPDDDEITFNDLKGGSGQSKAGYAKIRFCAEQAKKDGLQYFWVDTCCIDKADHAELSEAITSMFRWYRDAVKCFVYLSDVLARKRRYEQTERIHEITQLPNAVLLGATIFDFSVDERLRWAENRKTQRIEDKAYCLLGIFNIFMPTIYGERGNAFDRLKDKTSRSYRSQLDEIGQSLVTSKSCSLNDRGAELSPITTEQFSPHERRRKLLTSITFDQMDSRRATIKSAYSTTCEWLLKHLAHVDWINPKKLKQHRGVLWINGKPGAGKSTLVKYAHAHAIKVKPEHEIIISFFFNARGDELERSTIGMYRALLFHLLTKAADLQEVLDDLAPSSESRRQFPVWTIELLRELLVAAITRLGQRQLKCFIDALDECDEQQIREMIVFFEELGKKALENGIQFYVCFTSRHYPTIGVRSGRQLTLEKENGHGEDLAKYVQNHLRAGKGKHSEEIIEQIQEKANGVFMWAVLVIDILNKDFLSGRIFAVKKRQQEIPTKLSDLFKDILRRDYANMTDLLLCLQWILFARRPLRREEFYFAMVAGLDPEPENMIEWDCENITIDSMNRFVLNSSKGLAELTKSKTPTVQFIHESVRDFLLKDNGLCELWPEIGKDLYSLSHDQLKQCCQNYLNLDISGHVPSGKIPPKALADEAKNIRQVLTTNFPFLEYASRNVLYHADEAARGIPQTHYLEEFALDVWLKVNNLFERYDIRRHTLDASLLYILAENKLREADKDDVPSWLRANGHRDAVQALLQQVESSLIEDIVTHLEFSRAFSFRKDQTPLLWALDKGHKALVEVLLTTTDLEKGIDIKAKERDGKTALISAAKMGWHTIVQLLLDKSADIQAVDNNYKTALLWAVGEGKKMTVQLLLETGADPDSKDDRGRTPLSWAASVGHEAVVKLLLEKGADPKSKDKYGQTPLWWAASAGHEAVVKLLLEKGANPKSNDKYGRTPLWRAASAGHEAVMELLQLQDNI